MCLSPISIKKPNSDLRIFDSTQRFITVPCGKCAECIKNHSKLWAVRLMLEYYSRPQDEKDRSWFVTFTYDNEHNPGVLRPRDMTLFWKRLRKQYPDFKIKYFYCGEYGTKTYRPHYHAIIYNLPIEDLRYYKQNSHNDLLFVSEKLRQIWGNGYVVVGSLTLGSCDYTARYAIKKNNTDCYLRVSHGIGKEYFLQNMNEIIKNDYVTVAKKNGYYKSNIPKYFLKLYRKILNNDSLYSAFMREHMKKKENYNKLLEKYWPSEKYAWETDPLWKLKAKEIGLERKIDFINRRNKKVIEDSMSDILNSRDFLI